MSDYVLSCCSTVDLTPEYLAQRNIEWISFHFSLGGVEHADDMGVAIPPAQFYERMANGEDTSTSQVNVEEFLEYFEPFVAAGKDVLHVSLSSGLTGTGNSAKLAAETLMERYPGRRILVVDSLGASAGYGLFMDTLADRRNAGASLDELHQWALDNRLKLHHWFFSTDLTFYVKGGRVSPVSGFVGNLLKICPLLNMDNAGHLIPREKIRTKRKSMEAALQRMVEHAQGGLDYSGKCFISQSALEDDARELARMIEERFPKLDGPVRISWIGPTIGSHTGPGTVALFFWGDERVD